MKTVSTKLDNKLHEQFLDLCNNEGKCQSEFLREMIEEMFEGVDEENRPPAPQDLEIEVEEMKPEPVTIEPAIMAHGKILDDDGNVIGTF